MKLRNKLAISLIGLLTGMSLGRLAAQEVQKILDILKPLSERQTDDAVNSGGKKAETAKPAMEAAKAPAARHQGPTYLFRNGNVVRGTMTQERLPFETPYGTLHIPVAEILEINFSLKPLPEVEKAIAAAIAQLGSEAFEEREKATAELRENLLEAIPALKAALKTTDEEVRLRAESLLQDESNLPVDASEIRLRASLRENDLVVTTAYSIQGIVNQESFEVKSAYGKLAIPRQDLLSIRFRESGPESASISVPSSALIPSNWLDSKFKVEAGKTLHLTAAGMMEVSDWGESFGPEGSSRHGNYLGFNMLALVGKIGKNGETFLIGREYRGRANASGQLFLGIVPFRYSQAEGFFEVKIHIK